VIIRVSEILLQNYAKLCHIKNRSNQTTTMFKKIKNHLRDYFGFTQNETLGVITLIISVILLGIIPFAFDFFGEKKLPDESPEKVEELIKNIEIKEAEKKSSYNNNYKYDEKESKDFSEKRTQTLFNFDPNQASNDDFLKLGFPKWLANRIINYRSKGGKFKQKQDLLKIYDFPQDLYAQLENHIQIAGQSSSSPNNFSSAEGSVKKEEYVKKENKITTFDLNKADTTELIKLKGIGSKLAARIIKFRDNLGGFDNENQVREVFGLDSSTVDEVLKYGKLQSGTFRKLKINKATQDELKHPYLKPFIAKIIIAYRTQHGNFATRKDLENIKVLDTKTIDKLLPYIDFE
jgi:competence protein ComEA